MWLVLTRLKENVPSPSAKPVAHQGFIEKRLFFSIFIIVDCKIFLFIQPSLNSLNAELFFVIIGLVIIGTLAAKNTYTQFEEKELNKITSNLFKKSNKFSKLIAKYVNKIKTNKTKIDKIFKVTLTPLFVFVLLKQ